MSIRRIAASTAIAWACLLLVATSATAAPDGARVGVTPIEFSGEGAKQIDAALIDTLVRHDTDAVRLDARCGDTACRVEQARSKGVTHVVQLDVDADLNDYRMELTVYDAAGERVHGVRFACEICTPEDAAAAVTRQADALRPVLGVTTAATEGSDDAREPESAPSPRPVDDAPRTIGLDDRSTRRDRRMVIAGWTSAGAGLGMAIAGAVLIALDSRPYEARCTGDNRDVNGKCEFLYDTVAGGGTLVAIGGAALVTGIALAVVGHQRARNESRRVRAKLGPGGGHLEVAF